MSFWDWLRRLLCRIFKCRRDDFRGVLYFTIHWRLRMNLDITLGDGGTHLAVYTVTNLDGSPIDPANPVAISYASDNPAVCAVDPSSGALSAVAVGVANITGTGTRGAFTHSDSGTVTVAQSNDFAGVLTLT